MPEWGLTRTQRRLEPWGLDESWLVPLKVVTDPVHGDLYLTRLEVELVDSPPMQRLRRVRQLGTAHLVFPQATHSRFTHALGTLRTAQDLIDGLLRNREGARRPSSLLDEWEAAGELELRLAEATVLARLGGLLHDLCHVPIGHTVEDDLRVLTPHDRNLGRYLQLWAQIPEGPRMAIENARSRAAHVEGASLLAELRMLILSKMDPDIEQPSQAQMDDPPKADGELAPRSSYPFVHDVVGNTICADLLDYIRRDHYNSGLPLAVGSRFAQDFYVSRSDDVHYKQRMVVRVRRGGRLRSDVTTELLKYLRYRYELTERVLVHHAKTAADAMIGKLLEMWFDAIWLDLVAEHSTDLADDPQANNATWLRKQVALDDWDRDDLGARLPEQSDRVRTLDRRAREAVETEFLRWSDDGLLEHLASEAERHSHDARWRAIGSLATSVLERRLYKLVGHARETSEHRRKDKYRQFGGPSSRREREQAAAKLAGLDHSWQLLLWVPNPKMRLKAADVLIDDGSRIEPLGDFDVDASGIVKRHEDLWAVSVYADANLRRQADLAVATSQTSHEVTEEVRLQAALSVLRDDMDLDLCRHDGQDVLTFPAFLARFVAQELTLDRASEEKLAALAGTEANRAGRLEDALESARRIARENGLVRTRASRRTSER
jgi:HD superfamily phosphohydrolase